MTEFELAVRIANRFLDDGDAFGRRDPDGDECVLARQFNRLCERIDAVVRPFAEAADRQDEYNKSVKAKPHPDDSYGPGILMGDLRRARSLLNFTLTDLSQTPSATDSQIPSPKAITDQ